MDDALRRYGNVRPGPTRLNPYCNCPNLYFSLFSANFAEEYNKYDGDTIDISHKDMAGNKHPFLRRICRWTAGILLTPIVMVALLLMLFYMPPVQQWAVRRVAAYASEQTGMDIRLKRIRIKFPLDIDLQELVATTPPDTLLSVRHAVVDLDFSRIMKGRLAVSGIALQDGVADTRDLIATTVVKGRLGTFHLKADDISLKEQTVDLTAASLDRCELDIALRDTTVVDTTESAPVPWDIRIGDIEISRTRIAFHTAGDSLSVRGGVRTFRIKNGNVNLMAGIYTVEDAELEADSLMVNDMKLSDLRARLSRLLVDGTHVHAPQVTLATPHSTIDGNVRLDWSSLVPEEEQAGPHGRMEVALNASVGRADILALAGPYLTGEQLALVPEIPVELTAQARGNMDTLTVERGRLFVSPMADATVHGRLVHLLDTARMGADLTWDIRTFDLRPIKRMAGLGSNIRLPQMHLTGDTRLADSNVSADLQLEQDRGRVALKAQYDMQTEAYKARLDVHRLNLHNFLPKDSLYQLSTRAELDGRGMDFLSPATRARADILVSRLRYGRHDIDNVRLTANARKGRGQVNLSSDNDILRADACTDLQFSRKITYADFNLSVAYVDFHALGVTRRPCSASMLMQVDGSSNLRDTHDIKGSVSAMTITLQDTTFYPLDINLSLLLAPDTINAEATAGDLDFKVSSREGLDQVTDKGRRFYAEMQRQLSEHVIDQDTLKHLLPPLAMHIQSGTRNPLARISTAMGYTYDHLHLDFKSSPDHGLDGRGYVYAMNTGAILIDTIRWDIRQDTANVVRFDACVKNGPKNKQVVFESNLTANLTPTGADASLSFFDAQGRKGVDVGAQLFIEEDGYRVHFHPLNPILAYRKFTLNEDNYIRLHNNRRVEALVDLLADDGTGFKLYSTPNDDALQDITLSIHNFNLGELSNVIPYMPGIGGLLAGDFHLVQDEQSMTVVVESNVRRMTYEEAPMGDIGLNVVYLPNSDGTHYVDALVSQNGHEVATLAGTYNPEGQGNIEAEASLMRLPLALANGFIPDHTLELAGYASGTLSVTGTTSAPVLDGTLATDSMFVNSEMYSLHLRFPDDSIGIRQSRLDFNRIEAYAAGKNPLVLDGTVDFQNPSQIALNLSLSAKNFELINAPKSIHAVAYGKVFVDIGARLTGTLDNMVLRGKLNVLGNTDVTYVLTDSPLTVEDQLAELVTFVNFADSTEVEDVEKMSLQNIDMLIDIGIEQAAQVHCLLSADGTNHINVEGGGDLTMTYSTHDGMHLYGRYTIVNGVMNYSLMVVSLKNFTIQGGSYVEFTGDLTNPRLSISASERVKTTVYENNTPRSVNFDVGLAVSQTLDNMGLEFTLAAPSDMVISNELASMSQEERGKVAVTMLATGMYLTENSSGGGGGFNATNALNSFLQSQIAAVSNRALSTIDLNFGIDNTNTASGGMQTDYNFSFAKRFWGNRISLIVGGKVSSGSEAVNTGESIINNISIEYRLDKSATRYVRLYYDRDTESLLEGDITEMGAGLVLRRKSSRLGELFLFRKTPIPAPPAVQEKKP